jgi:phage baseplate assembly protein gpV
MVSIGEGTSLVKLSAGTLAIEAKEADAIANVPGGRVVTTKGGAATATVDKAGATTVDAHRGETSVETAKGTEKLAEGESITISAKGEVERAAPPPKRTVAAMTAGESPVFHDGAAPTPIRVAFPGCAGPGTVEVAKDRSFKRVIARSSGDGAANVLVPLGSFSYRVRCSGKGATGTIRVVKDTGRTPLPKAAAKTTVEMDGREYTILYQNLLPEVTLSWRTAPKKASYAFVVKPQSGAEKRFQSPAAKLTLKPGELREGTYTAWVEPAGGVRSEPGKIIIEFDNAAASASIDDVATNLEKTHVKGTVIEGSTVTVNGTPVQLDRHRRFETDLAPAEGEDGVAVRIANTKAGIHYYVMRTALH